MLIKTTNTQWLLFAYRTLNTQWLLFAYNNIKYTMIAICLYNIKYTMIAKRSSIYFTVLWIPLYTIMHIQQLSPIWSVARPLLTPTQNLNLMKMGCKVQYELYWTMLHKLTKNKEIHSSKQKFSLGLTTPPKYPSWPGTHVKM